MLQLEKVQKQYGSFTALDIDSFVIENGIVWQQGENGSGKTTLLKMIAGLLPFQGDISSRPSKSLEVTSNVRLDLLHK